MDVLIQKAQQPEWNLIVFAYFGIVTCIYRVGSIAYLGFAVGIANAKLQPLVDKIELVTPLLVDFMVLP